MFGLSKLRPAARLITARYNGAKMLQPLRQSGSEGWAYRKVDVDKPKLHKFFAEGLMAVMWYWVLFHVWYDYEHLTGHYAYPDPSKWTDAELGIPPVEEE